MDQTFLLDSGKILLKAFLSAKRDSHVLTSLIEVVTQVLDLVLSLDCMIFPLL